MRVLKPGAAHRRNGSRTEPSPVARWELVALAAITLLGLALRVAYTLAMQDNPNHHDPGLDSAYHVDWARSLAAGEPYGPLVDRPFFRAPLYIWFLAGCFAVFGDGLLAPRLVQSGLGAATVALVFLVARRAFGARVAPVAALLAASYWVLIYYDAELLIPTLAVPLYLLGIWLTLALARDDSARALVGCGLVWGVSVLARPNVLLFLPCIAVWLVAVRRPELGRGLRAAALFGLAVLAPILPVTAYNTFVKHDFVLVSSQGGVNFWIGNNPYTDGHTAIVPGTRAGWWDGYHDSINLAEQAEGRPLRASEVSRHYARRAWTFLLTDPARSLPLLARKLGLFFTSFEYANNQEPYFFAHHYSWVPRVSIGFAVLMPLACVGLALCARSPLRLFPLWGFALVYTLSVVAFFVNARFRAPVLPVMMVLAALALVSGYDAARARRWGPLLAASIVAVALGTLSVLAAPPRSVSAVTAWVQLGVAEGRRGNLAASVGHFRSALALDPDHDGALVNLGKAERLAGRDDEALRHFARAVALRPLRVDALEWQLAVLFELGRLGEAEAAIDAYLDRLGRAGAERTPATPYYHLGRIRAARGDGAGARAALLEAQRRDPRAPRTPIGLAQLATARGAWGEAAGHYVRALELLDASAPTAEAAHAGLVEALARSGARDEACLRATEWTQRRPSSTQAADTRLRICGLALPRSHQGSASPASPRSVAVMGSGFLLNRSASAGPQVPRAPKGRRRRTGPGTEQPMRERDSRREVQ